MEKFEQQGILSMVKMDSLLQGQLLALQAVAYSTLAAIAVIDPAKAPLLRDLLQRQFAVTRQRLSAADSAAAETAFDAVEFDAFDLVDTAERIGRDSKNDCA